ncbi:MAG: RHS repeat-associated core domain-containing protein [Acidobacteria bacterium]|nr:RHS repeat-associated core domain-containing protein [Acidobacteriota bacterium]
MKPIYAVLAVAALSIAIPAGLAQQVTGNGTPAYNSFSGGPDLINDGNLNFHFGVPVFARGGRGMPFSLSLPIDNGAWYTYQDIYANWHMGVNFSTAQPAGVLAIGTIFYFTTPLQCPNPDDPGVPIQYTKRTFTGYQSPDNTTHPFGYGSVYVYDGNQLDCAVPKYDHPTGTTSDGSGISITATYGPSTVTYPNGQVVHPPSIESGSNGVNGSGTYTTSDVNGNTITVNTGANQGQINSIADTLGTQPITVTGGPPPTAVNYQYPAPSGATAKVTITYTTKTIQSAFACPGIADQSATSKTLIDRITLPDTTYYQFTYEKTTPTSGNYTGRITQVHVPTGGTITYNYTGGDTGKGVVCADGSTSGFDRVSTQSGTVHYSRAITSYDPNNSHKVKLSTTSITDNDGNVTKVDFSYGVELQRRVYQGAATGTPLETVITCYNGTDPIDPNTCSPPPASQTFTRVTVFRSLNGGPYSRVDTFYNSDGSRVIKTDEYDWGASSYTRETQITYDTTLGRGIVNHPSSVKAYVYDGAGNSYLKSQTDYSYDDFTIPGDTVTCAPATRCRGNLTTIIKYVDSSHTLTSHITYNLSGTVAASQDPNGTTTTYAYGSGGCNSAFPTQTQVVFGSTTLTTSTAYNCTGAVAISHTDVNGKLTSASYTDPFFWRPSATMDELQTTPTTYSYNAGATIIESAMNFNANRSTVDVRSTRDSFGRSVYGQKRQGYNSTYYDTVQQLYDTAGRPIKTSMAYQGTAGQSPSSGIYTQNTFDAMMRITRTQDAGGGVVNTSYLQNYVYREAAPAPAGSTESTKAKQSEYDGLGRLKSVCEITRDTQYGGACNQVGGGYSGYLTTYVYDTPPYINSLTVRQNTQPNGGTTQSRTYRYDMLGRLTYESNPETGANQYVYDSLTGDTNCGTVSSPGDAVKTIDNKGLVSCLTYDGLHRVLSVLYPNAPVSPITPAKKYVYESAVVNGTTMSLTEGRLAEAYTCTGSCTTKITDVGLSYTERGEIKDVYESTPHSSGYYHVSASYWEHGTLKSLSSPGLPTIYYGGADGSGLDGEGRVNKVTASAGNNPVSSVIYTTSGTSQPIGSLTSVTLGSGDSDAFGYDTLTGRLISYTFNMNSSVAKSGGLTWNANGTLGQIALTDNVNTANTQSCTYSHDDLGRISSANCSSNKWGQTFSYDPFGNVTKSATVGTTFLPTYDLTTNRFNTMPGCTPSYDLDGNLLNDCSHIYTWQADGAVATVDTVQLNYDALGRLVEQQRGSNYTEIVYTPGGAKLAMMNGATLRTGFISLPGGGTAVYSSAGLLYYRHTDWLGSSRLATSATTPTTVYADAEYAPYGEVYGASGSPDYNFTGQNQDTVASSSSGLYDFLFREYNPQHGRWTSPDPAGIGSISMGSPQSWNRYAYVANGPLHGADSLGLFRDRMELFGLGGGRGSNNDDPFAAITDASSASLALDFGAAFMSFENQQFQEQAGLTSPIQQGLNAYLTDIDGPGTSVGEFDLSKEMLNHYPAARGVSYILSGSNPCSDWLNNATSKMTGGISSSAQNVFDTTAIALSALSGQTAGGTTQGSLSAAIYLNPLGGFFQQGRGSFGGYASGSTPYGIVVLLHELAHKLNAIQSDGPALLGLGAHGNTGMSYANTGVVLLHCQSAINGD